MQPPIEDSLRAIVELARTRLGLASERLCLSEDVQARILARVRGRNSVEDAVLAELYQVAKQDRAIAEEFMGWLLPILGRRAALHMSPALRRHLDAGDVVDSVMGDFGNELFDLTFRSKAQFLKLLDDRLRWKARDRAVQVKARPEVPLEAEVTADEKGPITIVVEREQLHRVLIVLHVLKPTPRVVVAQLLAGDSAESLSQRLGISIDAARKAIERAVKALQQALGVKPQEGRDRRRDRRREA